MMTEPLPFGSHGKLLDYDGERDVSSDEKRAELRAMLKRINDVSGGHYYQAVRIACHPFIKFTGMMKTWGELCQDALDAGIDFRWLTAHEEPLKPLPARTFRMKYLGEKFACVFGPWLENAAMRATFLHHAGLGHPSRDAAALVDELETANAAIARLTHENQELRARLGHNDA